MKKKHIAIIGTVGLPAKYGGFETLAEHLVEHLTANYDVSVYCSKKQYKKEDRLPTYKGASLKYLPLEANGIQSIFYDTWSILDAIRNSDVLLILGVAGAWVLPFVKFFTNKKIIISIDGIEWKRDKWPLLAKLYLFWAEKIAVKYSHIDISDNESIQDYTGLRYQTLSRIIEYGGDHTLKVLPTPDDDTKYPFLKQKYAFKVCRIEPENNVHVVIEAFEQFGKMQLVMVGNWKNSDYGIQLKAKYANSSHILLLDPIYNQRELDVLRGNATLYVHGHAAGGTNPSLVEAMYLGLPIIAFKVSYNKTTTEHKALYFENASDLVSHLEVINEGLLSTIAKSMKEIADKRYTWEIIAHKYELLVIEALKSEGKYSIHADVERLDDDFLTQHNLGHLKHTNYFYEDRK